MRAGAGLGLTRSLLASCSLLTRPPPPLMHLSAVLGARRRVSAPPRATLEEAGVIARNAAAEKTEAGPRKFLIDNSHNDVHLLQCPTRPVLQQGILETADLPHICVAGESNAGKSSLLNHLLAKKSLAKASSVAGKTRSVDMMLVNDAIVVTDLPGLPSRDHQVAEIWERTWRPLVLDYVGECDGLLGMLYVHDVRWKVSAQVREFLDDVREAGLPVLLVLTKDDKIISDVRAGEADNPRAEHELRERYMVRARRALGFDGVHLHYSTDSSRPSARKARRRLLRYIESMVAAGSREECAKLLDGIAQRSGAEASANGDA